MFDFQHDGGGGGGGGDDKRHNPAIFGPVISQFVRAWHFAVAKGQCPDCIMRNIGYNWQMLMYNQNIDMQKDEMLNMLAQGIEAARKVHAAQDRFKL